MKRGLRAVLIILMVAASSAAEMWYYEIDLDGVPGNGPDTIDAAPGDLVTGRVWIHGDCPVVFFGVGFCAPDGVLQYQIGSEVYLLPETWTSEEVTLEENCITAQATDFTFENPIALPAPLADLQWRIAADETIGALVCNPGGAFLSICMGSPVFDHCDGAVVRVGATATQAAGWGAIKTLFR